MMTDMLDDLSRYHEPISSLFQKPASPEEWERCRLSEDQIEFFNENRYLAGVRMADATGVQVA